MAGQDYYKTLGVSREASDDEIRKAYRALVRKYHPDVKPNDKEAAARFKDIQEAYDVLGDTEKRAQYDRYGTAFRGGPGGGSHQWSTGAGGAGPIDLGDLFGGGGIDLGSLFGGRGGGGGFHPGGRPQQPRPSKGQDIRLEIEVPFQVAAEGGQHGVQLNVDGNVERLSVKIPAGIESGNVVRLAGQGHPGTAGGPKGDLRLTVRVAPHPYFRREGRNLLLEVPITPAEAVLGARVEVPTLTEGRVTVTIPPGTSSGQKLRLRGKGIPDQRTKERGDQFVITKIVVPREIDEETRDLYEQIASRTSATPRDGLWS